jgi:hypothetical protein
MTPTVGRIVHYHTDFGGTPGVPRPVAAMITAVLDDGVNLTVFVPGYSGLPLTVPDGGLRTVPEASEPTLGHWNWPPRVEAGSGSATDAIMRSVADDVAAAHGQRSEG